MSFRRENVRKLSTTVREVVEVNTGDVYEKYEICGVVGTCPVGKKAQNFMTTAEWSTGFPDSLF